MPQWFSSTSSARRNWSPARPAVEVVELLNRFFAVIVEEVDRHHGFVNKFEGDAALAVFGVPVALDHAEDEALAAARAIARRLSDEVPECQAGIGVAAGEVVAGNVGAKERFEYTVIGEPVNEAARLCELAKDTDARLVASSEAVSNATDTEGALDPRRHGDPARPRRAHPAAPCPSDPSQLLRQVSDTVRNAYYNGRA